LQRDQVGGGSGTSRSFIEPSANPLFKNSNDLMMLKS
jgi:hypothetical protein